MRPSLFTCCSPAERRRSPASASARCSSQSSVPTARWSCSRSSPRASVKPGAPVRGEVLVQCEGAPVPGAEFLVFAVDEAVLKLGDWKLPDPRRGLLSRSAAHVSTLAALTRFVEKIDPKSLEQKGYVVGGGGEGIGNVALRKEFKTLAFWQSGLTDR